MPEEDKLLKLYHEFNSNRIDYNTRKWETVKFFTSLNAAFITATIAIATFIYKNGSINFHTKLFLSVMPVGVIIVSILGLKNLKRESKLLFEQEASMFKIEKYLDLHNEIPIEKRWLKGDPYLVPTKHHRVSYGTGLQEIDPNTLEDWVNARLHKHGFLTSIMTGMFEVEIGIALALLGIIFLSI